MVPGQEPADHVPGYVARTIEGWTVHLDNALLKNAHRGEEGTEPAQGASKTVLRKNKVNQLQRIPIVFDLRHEDLKSMQYHPEKKGLRKHGYPEEMEKMVHIPRLDSFASRKMLVQQPMVLMHELAHGYHDQVLGFGHQRNNELFERVRGSGKLDRVLHISGKKKRHYALTDRKEFFAEMTEAYLGTNDFYPFVSGELQEEFPEVYAYMESVWGSVP